MYYLEVMPLSKNQWHLVKRSKIKINKMKTLQTFLKLSMIYLQEPIKFLYLQGTFLHHNLDFFKNRIGENQSD